MKFFYLSVIVATALSPVAGAVLPHLTPLLRAWCLAAASTHQHRLVTTRINDVL